MEAQRIVAAVDDGEHAKETLDTEGFLRRWSRRRKYASCIYALRRTGRAQEDGERLHQYLRTGGWEAAADASVRDIHQRSAGLSGLAKRTRGDPRGDGSHGGLLAAGMGGAGRTV